MTQILIAGNPRSGTSMTAGLIARHGVQVGEQRRPNPGNPRGGYENRPISAYLKVLLVDAGYGINPGTGAMPAIDWPTPKRFKETVEAAMPDPSEPWLYKNFRLLPTAGAWISTYPQARWVLPVRNRVDTLTSMVRHHVIGRHGSPAQLAAWLDWSVRRQEEIAKRAMVFWFDVDAAWSGNDGHIADMLAFCGLRMETARVSGWIDRGLWHNRAGAA